MRSTTYLLAIASLLAIPMFAVAQKGPCGNGVSLCQIGPNQRCPIGCIKRANCPTTTRTSTVTSTITSTVSKTSITTRLSTSSFTSTITITATPTYAAAPDPSGTNPAVSAILPGACIFQQPYVNLFTFVDDNCGNGTIRDLQLDGFGNREVRNGLNQYPNKLQKVSTQSGYYGTACKVCPVDVLDRRCAAALGEELQDVDVRRKRLRYKYRHVRSVDGQYLQSCDGDRLEVCSCGMRRIVVGCDRRKQGSQATCRNPCQACISKTIWE